MANLILQQGLSFVRYQADGATNAFGISFTYLTPSDIHVFNNGDEVSYTYINSSEIALDIPAAADDNVVLNRSVKSDARYVDFQNGGQVRESILDLDSNQIFMMAQEAIDTAGLNLFVSPVTGTIDMKGSRVINVGEPMDDTDAMTFGSSKTAVATATTKAAEAAASAAAALVSQNAASASYIAANTAANIAATARDDAQTAVTNTELAQSGAVSAQSAAEYYKDLAEAAAATATAQAGIATNAGNDAADAADLALSAKSAAEAAQAAVAADASTASAAASSAEGFRDEAEDFAIAAEASALASVSPRIATLSDVKPSGTAGGTATAGSYQTRTLNTIDDPTGIVTSLSGNQFTLPAGEYYIESSAPALQVGTHKTKIRNISDSTDALIGQNCASGGGDSTPTHSRVCGAIIISSSKTFELQHRVGGTSATSGYGVATSFGDSEVYSILKITKVN